MIQLETRLHFVDQLQRLRLQLAEGRCLDDALLDCTLPVVVLNEQRMISGLTSAVRQMFNSSPFDCEVGAPGQAVLDTLPFSLDRWFEEQPLEVRLNQTDTPQSETLLTFCTFSQGKQRFYGLVFESANLLPDRDALNESRTDSESGSPASKDTTNSELNIDISLLPALPQPAFLLNEKLKLEQANELGAQALGIDYPGKDRCLNDFICSVDGVPFDLVSAREIARTQVIVKADRSTWELTLTRLTVQQGSRILATMTPTPSSSSLGPMPSLMPDELYAVVDRFGVVQSVNEEFCKWFGGTSESWTHQRLLKIADAGYQERVSNCLDEVRRSNESASIEFSCEDQFGNPRWLLWSIPAPVDAKSDLAMIGREVTQRRMDEGRLKQAKQEAEEATLARTNFLAVVSHEMRTPLNGIMGMLDLTLSSEMTPEQRDNLECCAASVRQLSDIIDDVLDFSRIETGKFELDNHEFDLTGVLLPMLRTYHKRATAVGLRFSWTFDERLPSTVCGDPLRLRQILVNLLSNAIKFTARGEINVSVVVDSHDATCSNIRFCVSDTGCGIPAADRQKVFQHFVQLDSSPTRKYEGMGLGLAICQKLTRAMEGHLWVESEMDQGSEFFVTLPFRRENRSVTTDACEVEAHDAQASHPVQVLIAEDDLVNQRFIGRLLEQHGCEVTVAGDGQAAVEIFEADPIRFDIVLMDLMMPRLSGLDAARKMKAIQQQYSVETPIIAMTARAMKDDRKACIAAGMTDYVPKPIDRHELWSKVSALVTENRSQRRPSLETAVAAFDATQLLDRFEQDREWIGQMIDIFGETLQLELPALATAVETEQSAQVEHHAHKLASSVSYLCSPRNLELARELETLARSGTSREIAATFQKLDAGLKLLGQQLESWKLQLNERSEESPTFA